MQEYVNPRTGSSSWRVAGTKRDGTRIRENYSDADAASKRQLALEAEWHAKETASELRATRLTDAQVGIAEAVFKLVDNDEDALTAVQYWLRTGKSLAVNESPRLDAAFDEFTTWLEAQDLRPRTRENLDNRVGMFVNSTPNLDVCDVTAEHVEKWLAGRNVSARTRRNDKIAVSRFFSWCLERPRGWLLHNPAHAVRLPRITLATPAIMPVDDCAALLAEADRFKRGRLLPYMVVCLFAGLRPYEAARLKWSQVNLADGEIRLEPTQTKTKRGRVVVIPNVLKFWLKRCQGAAFFPPNFSKDFRAVRRKIGYGSRDEVKRQPQLKLWQEDILRHTAVSHYFRLHGSFGLAAEWAGNSEEIIKRHYNGRVSSADTERFYNLLPPNAKSTKIIKLARRQNNIVALKGGAS